MARESSRHLYQRRLESIAPADGGDFQVEAGVLRVLAVFDEILGCLPSLADLVDHLLVLPVVLAEMGAQAALAFMNGLHVVTPLIECLANRGEASLSHSRPARLCRPLGDPGGAGGDNPESRIRDRTARIDGRSVPSS
jgi:hypothetical protein